ncbi:hypothetical protein J6P59_02920 [bacterium]|nr:hypothetical protein [bacterium]
MLAYQPQPPSSAALIFGIILLFIIPIVGLILIIYYIVAKSNYNRAINEYYGQQQAQANHEPTERL